MRELWDALIRESSRAEVMAILKGIALWGALGAVIGLALGLAAYFGFRRLQWYNATSRSGRWTQRGAGMFGTLVSLALLGGAGCWEGVHRRAQDFVSRSQLGTEVLPAVASQVADGVAWIDLALERQGPLEQAAVEARLAAFRAGAWELNPATLLQRVDTVRDEVLREVVRQLERAALEKSPGPKGGIRDEIVRSIVRELAPLLLEKKLSAELRKQKFDHLHTAFRNQLVAEATLAGDPATIGYRDLSAFIQREGLVPALVSPARSFARRQQAIYVSIALLVCLLPPSLCRAFRPKPAAPPAGPV